MSHALTHTRPPRIAQLGTRVAALLAVAALGIAACSSSGNTSSTRALAGSRTGSLSTGASSTGTELSSQALSSQDSDYLTTSAQGDRFEVLGGKAAASHAASAPARAFGQRMVSDHTSSYSDLAKQAPGLGVSVPTQPDQAEQRILTLLGQLSGSRFDCTYLVAEYDDHIGDVAMTKLEMASGQNPQVKQLAAQDLPMLEQHLKLAESDLEAMTHCS